MDIIACVLMTAKVLRAITAGVFIPVADGVSDPVAEVLHRWMKGAAASGGHGRCHAEKVAGSNHVVLRHTSVIGGVRESSQGVDEMPRLAQDLQGICPRSLRI